MIWTLCIVTMTDTSVTGKSPRKHQIQIIPSELSPATIPGCALEIDSSLAWACSLKRRKQELLALVTTSFWYWSNEFSERQLKSIETGTLKNFWKFSYLSTNTVSKYVLPSKFSTMIKSWSRWSWSEGAIWCLSTKTLLSIDSEIK